MNVPQALPASVTSASSPSTSVASASTSIATTSQGPQPPSKRNFAHGRRLRQRQERNYNENGRRASFAAPSTSTPGSSLPGSPIKNGTAANGGDNGPSSSVVGTDLQSSLNLYFGAAHRILSGERFVIKGRRVSVSGKVQYLIEWEGCPASQVM